MVFKALTERDVQTDEDRFEKKKKKKEKKLSVPTLNMLLKWI